MTPMGTSVNRRSSLRAAAPLTRIVSRSAALTKPSSTTCTRAMASTSITSGGAARGRWKRDLHPAGPAERGRRARARPPHCDRGVGGAPRGVLDRLEPEGRDQPSRADLLDATAKALRLLSEDLEHSSVLEPDV